VKNDDDDDDEDNDDDDEDNDDDEDDNNNKSARATTITTAGERLSCRSLFSYLRNRFDKNISFVTNQRNCLPTCLPACRIYNLIKSLSQGFFRRVLPLALKEK